MKYFTRLLFVTATAALGCKGDDTKAHPTDSSLVSRPSLSVSTKTQTPRIIFHIPPLVATPARPAERADTLWSPNDDRDSVEITLAGVSDSARVSMRIDALVEPQSREENPPTKITKGRRVVTWQTVKDIRLDSVARFGNEYLLVRLTPSGLNKDRTIPLNAREEVGGIRVMVTLPDGHTATATLTLLPAI